MSFHLKPGYVERPQPAYYPDDNSYGFTAQPDVYPYAAGLACAYGLRTLIDLGCGRGHKLAPLHDAHPDWRFVGIDHGDNIEWAQRNRDWGEWIHVDLEHFQHVDASDAVLVCADVIEHLRDPRPLLETIRGSGAVRTLLSTPERDLTWGPEHNGPPPNDCHVREWNRAELQDFLNAEGCDVETVGLTASDDAGSGYLTTLAVLR